VRSIFQLQRKALPFLAGVENGHASSERNFCGPFVQDFPLQLDGSLNRFVSDAKFQIGALHGVGHGWRVRLSNGFTRELQEMVVLIKRERNVPRRGDGRERGLPR